MSGQRAVYVSCMRGGPMQALYGLIADRGYSPAVQQWLGSNLVPARNRDGLVWSFDVGGEARVSLTGCNSGLWMRYPASPSDTECHPKMHTHCTEEFCMFTDALC